MSGPRDAALSFLFSRIDYERVAVIPYGERAFRLDRMRDLLARLGNPHEHLPIVHVAGTKGKGSTAAMIAAVLSAAGYRTGLYSSPHLERVEERMRVDGEPCAAAELIDLVETLRPVVAEMDQAAARRGPPDAGPTYFEMTTAMGLLHFARRGLQAAVLEVGLGGRLDSTNVCRPIVSVITSISFDHMRQLGNTLAAIATEKAGIIKPGVPVVSGVTVDEPRAVIEAIAARRGSRLAQLGRDFGFDYEPPRGLEQGEQAGLVDYRVAARAGAGGYGKLPLGLHGRHQAANAAVALSALGELERRGWEIGAAAVRRGLAELRWPARVEVLGRRPTVVLDAAHNVASIEALLATLDESFSARRRLLVFATTQEKEIAGMLALLLPRFEQVIFTRYLNNPRSVPPETLADLAATMSASPPLVCPDPPSAWKAVAGLAGEDDLICITGSFFIAAEMRAQLAASAACPAALVA